MPIPAFTLEKKSFYLSNDSNQIYHLEDLTFEAGALYRSYSILTCQLQTPDAIEITIPDFANSVRRLCTPAEIENLQIPPYISRDHDKPEAGTIYVLQWDDGNTWTIEGFALTLRQALHHYRIAIKDHPAALKPWRVAQYAFIQAQAIEPPKANPLLSYKPGDEIYER